MLALRDTLMRTTGNIITKYIAPKLLKKNCYGTDSSVKMAFAGKVVLVTGASIGIGAATAINFAKLGATLALTDRPGQNFDAVVDKCKSGETFVVSADITKPADVKNIIESTIKHYNRLDVLVNNAGIFETGTIENTSLEQYDRVFNINVRGVYNVTMLACPHIVKAKGNIVNVSSVVGIRSFPNILAYCMSKSAVDQFTRCTCLELAPNVRVNAVNPGVIVTDLFKSGGMTDEEIEAFYENAKQTHVLGRPGDPSEIAKAITFLASDDASFITGVSLLVDGGKHTICPR